MNQESKRYLSIIKSIFLICVVLGTGAFQHPIPHDMNSLPLQIGQSFRSEEYVLLNSVKESYPLVVVYVPTPKSLQRGSYLNEIKEAVKKKKISPSQIVFVFTAITTESLDFLSNDFSEYPVYRTQKNIYDYSSPTTVAYSADNKLTWSEEVYTAKLLISKITTHLKGNKDRDTFIDSDLMDVNDSTYRSNIVYKHPLPQVPDLSRLKSITNVSATNPTLVIYTFSGCKPCITLAQNLEKEYQKGTVDAKKIVFINLIDKVTPFVAQEIRNKYGSFPYYIMKSNAETFPYPTVVAFTTQGEVEWIEYGYNFSTYKAIKKHLIKREGSN
ncbi:MAG: hypothetical protein J5I91_01830 [Bacteroidetes bacterium]|nr:hypothetical protein [Bacteroidota bacterium]